MSLDIKINMDQISKDHTHESFSTLVSDHINKLKHITDNEQGYFPRTEAIIQSLPQKSEEINSTVHFEEVGTVQHIGNGVRHAHNASSVSSYQLALVIPGILPSEASSRKQIRHN